MQTVLWYSVVPSMFNSWVSQRECTCLHILSLTLSCKEEIYTDYKRILFVSQPVFIPVSMGNFFKNCSFELQPLLLSLAAWTTSALSPQLSLRVWRRRWPTEVWSSWRALSDDRVASTQGEAAHWAVLLLWGAEQEHSERTHRDLWLPAFCAQPSQHFPRKPPLSEWKLVHASVF